MAKRWEELGELEVEVARKDQVRMEEEFGDFMFAMINAALTIRYKSGRCFGEIQQEIYSSFFIAWKESSRNRS